MQVKTEIVVAKNCSLEKASSRMVIAKAGIILFAITKAGIIFLSQNVESFVGLRCDVKSVEKGRGCRRARVK